MLRRNLAWTMGFRSALPLLLLGLLAVGVGALLWPAGPRSGRRVRMTGRLRWRIWGALPRPTWCGSSGTYPVGL